MGTVRHTTAASPRRSRAGMLGRSVVLVAALSMVAGLVAAPGSLAQTSGGDDSGGDGTGTSVPAESQGRSSTTQHEPRGAVAYVTADRRVWLGTGNGEPTEIGALAGFGPNGQAAVAISPTGESVAFVRADGSVAVVADDGSGLEVVATDAALEAVGGAPTLVWDGTGDHITYVAEGTPDQVADSSTRSRSRAPGSNLTQLPDGPLGNVLATVNVSTGKKELHGDPSLRSVFGIAGSLTDPVVVVQTEIPGTDDRYTLALAAPGSDDFAPTPFSVDDPDFSPGGGFVIASGPSKGVRELIRVDLATITRETLTTDESICAPVVSPDSTRIVYGGGEDCNRLMLVSAEGGRSFDITPANTPDTASFGEAALGWTSDGRFVTYPECTGTGEDLSCGGPSVFVEPDSGRVLDGPEAVTVSPIRRALIQDIWVDFTMGGPIEVSQSFPISAEIEGDLTETETSEVLEATLNNGTAVLDVRLTASEDGFITGTMAVDDPEAGVDRTFAVLARTTLLGLRIVSMTGMWMSTSEMPFATGEFTLALRRR
ncbi:MAG: hypothetical protein M9942_09955 [Microthrixaceae bacterium]|nr:hypothetical protein [Microthrixaceae bacterium]